MKYAANILNEIPFEKRSIVLKKMESFEKIILETFTMNDIPKGFWVRKIIGTDTYKIRVNNGDRLLFRFLNDENGRSIVFTSYCNHDSQIRVGKSKNYNKINYVEDLNIITSEYEENELDEKIENYVKSKMYNELQLLQNDYVIEDEYISLSVDEDDYSQMKFLSIEQFECLTHFNKAVILFGCAGSGKTNIAIRKMQLNSEHGFNTCYITTTPLIKERAIKLYESTKTIENNSSKFYTFRELCKNILNLNDIVIIEYTDFFNWINKKLLLKKYDINLGSMDIWVEINSFIKGKAHKDKLITLEDYLNIEGSNLSKTDRKKVYNIARLYESWLGINNYLDDNDIAFLAQEKINKENKFDFIIFDEFQELTERQIDLIFKMARDMSNTMFIGDVNQIINLKYTNIQYLKNIYYKYNIELIQREIYKNYRNTYGIVNWVNKLNDCKANTCLSTDVHNIMRIIPIKDGNRPFIYYNLDDKINFFDKVDNYVDSIIIVADEEEKLKLKEEGMKISRVFTLQEIRGLDYKNIYCYNLISKFKNIWEVIDSKDKVLNNYVNSFNKLYLAATRAKNNLFFIETYYTKLNSILDNYCCKISEELGLFKESSNEIIKNKWISEAKNLELEGRYYQAGEAYKKGGDLTKANICFNAHRRESDYANLDKFKSSIVIESSSNITESIVEKILDEIDSKYDIRIGGFIDIIRFDKVFNTNCKAQIRISHSSSFKENAKEICNEIRGKNFEKNNITIQSCFYQLDEPIDFKLLFGKENNSIKVAIHNENIEISLFRNDLIISNHKNCDSRSVLDIEKKLSEYEDKSADDILDFIFK